MVRLVSRYNGLYRDRGGLEAAGLLYCNTPWCIVTEGGGGKETCVARQATTRPCLRATQGHDTAVKACDTGDLGLRYGSGPRPRHGRSAHDTAMHART